MSFQYDKNGTLWVGTSARVYRLTRTTVVTLALPLAVTDFAEDSSGAI